MRKLKALFPSSLAWNHLGGYSILFVGGWNHFEAIARQVHGRIWIGKRIRIIHVEVVRMATDHIKYRYLNSDGVKNALYVLMTGTILKIDGFMSKLREWATLYVTQMSFLKFDSRSQSI